MEWPVSSPDMNPIEHVWDALGRRVAGRQPSPQTLQELERAFLEDWGNVAEFAIRLLLSNSAAIPEEATANATLRSLRIFSRSKLNETVLPVPPGGSRKKRPPSPSSTHRNILL
ncbi:transposable element Tcb2 transposase [Trichonephila clavipes]|nr:transposable element Tcb2 transposase [Trichonephila clavipes]